jgi:hypothetical protein
VLLNIAAPANSGGISYDITNVFEVAQYRFCGFALFVNKFVLASSMYSPLDCPVVGS